jgi:ribose transport system substrate-binding protein
MSETESAAAAAAGKQPRPSGGFHVLPIVAIAAVLVLVGLAVAWKGNVLRPKPKLLLITSTENPYWDRVILGAQEAAKQVGAELTTIRNKGDVKQQLQSIKEVLDSGVSGIAVSPIDPDAQTAPLADAAKKAALVTIDSDCPGSDRVAFIGTDNYFAGRECGRLVRDAIPDGGEVIICVGSVRTNGQDRRRGLMDVLLDRPLDRNRAPDPIEGEQKGAKYTVVATLLDNVDRAKATELAADAITKHPNVKCMVGLFGYNTPAILEALNKAGKLGQIRVVGFDDAEQTLAGIEAGHVYGSVVQDQYNMGFDAVMVLWGAARGTPGVTATTPGGSKFLPSQAFTKDNVIELRMTREREAKSQAPAASAPATAPTK